jgi:SNF2 family DNA or RNA helicase
VRHTECVGTFISQVPKPDIVITSYEAAAADAPALKAIAWEVVLLDERQRGRAGLAKV